MQFSRPSIRSLVVLVAVLSIAVHVSTRSFHPIDLTHPTAQANAPTKHQHLDADAFELIDPVLPTAMLQPLAAPHVPPEEAPPQVVEFADSLYNRPPPASSLL